MKTEKVGKRIKSVMERKGVTLEELAERTGRTKSYYIKEAIAEQIADLEDFYLAEQRMRDYDARENATLSEMIKRDGVAR